MTDDFYEDDEPVDEVVAAFERGRQDVTAPLVVRNVHASGLELMAHSFGPLVRVQPHVYANGPARPSQVRTMAIPQVR